MSNVITLEENVIISDPCYEVPTWTQMTLSNVLAGDYRVHCRKVDAGDWGNRVSMLLAVHGDHEFDTLDWVQAGTIGVDSGQAGIFNRTQYRQDNEYVPLGDGDISFFTESFYQKDGDRWYIKVCSHTLGVTHWGSYRDGAVSSSGFGDGGYNVYTASINGNVVAICIDYEVEDDAPYVDFDFYKNPLNN
jgi:hypothetical protein